VISLPDASARSRSCIARMMSSATPASFRPISPAGVRSNEHAADSTGVRETARLAPRCTDESVCRWPFQISCLREHGGTQIHTGDTEPPLQVEDVLAAAAPDVQQMCLPDALRSVQSGLRRVGNSARTHRRHRPTSARAMPSPCEDDRCSPLLVFCRTSYDRMAAILLPWLPPGWSTNPDGVPREVMLWAPSAESRAVATVSCTDPARLTSQTAPVLDATQGPTPSWMVPVRSVGRSGCVRPARQRGAQNSARFRDHR
jgi:hypothetical protein